MIAAEGGGGHFGMGPHIKGIPPPKATKSLKFSWYKIA
jgi:hypothetical protein